MAIDEKDRLGNKLHDAEAAREEQWARQRDAELLDKMRHRLSAMVCPHCKRPLEAKSEGGVPMMACPAGEGAWLEEKSLRSVLKKPK